MHNVLKMFLLIAILKNTNCSFYGKIPISNLRQYVWESRPSGTSVAETADHAGGIGAAYLVYGLRKYDETNYFAD